MYGTELIIDMHNCNVSKFNRKSIKEYFSQLCELIGMKAEDLYFWDDYRVPLAKRQTNPKTSGITAIQFILTSNITIHTLDLLGIVFINILSCKPYNSKRAEQFSVQFFEAEDYRASVVERGIV